MDYIGFFLEANPVSHRTIHIASTLADGMKIAVQDNNIALYQKYIRRRKS